MMYSKNHTINNILIITDYKKNSGLGNYIRSKYIFQILKKKKNINVDFLVYSNSNKIFTKYDILVLDLPDLKYNLNELIKKFSKKNTKVIGLDYNFKNIIDCNIGLFSKNNFVKKNYVNLKYCVIRKEFSRLTIKKNNQIFLISIGSSDIKNVRNKLKKIFFKFYEKIYLSSKIKNLNNSINQRIFLKKMASCDLAASNGGTTLLELLYLKKIVFVYPQNNLELKFSKFLKKKGFIIFINKYRIDSKIISNARKNIQKKKIIDNLGAERITKIILKYKK
jgi:hypothetical protein